MTRLKRIAIPLGIITTLLGTLHFFIYSMASRSVPTLAPWLAATLIVGIFLMPAAVAVNLSPWRRRLEPVTIMGYSWLGIFLIALFFSAIEAIASMFWYHGHSEWILEMTGVMLLWSLRKGLIAPKVVRHTLLGPAFLEGLTLVQISDLHVGMPFLNQAWLSRVVDQISALSPDIVVITGDLVDGEFADVTNTIAPLEKIKGIKYYITGNHEYIRGGDWELRLRELGFRVLHNSHDVLERKGKRLLIAGVPDRMVNRFAPNLKSQPDVALQTETDVDYKILLAHEPSSVRDLKEQKADLMLSGHTHGGQIFPFGYLVRMVQPVVKGFKSINGTLVFAHQGTGFWGPPLRWFSRSEIVAFTWTPAPQVKRPVTRDPIAEAG